jgi:hypothetical protein
MFTRAVKGQRQPGSQRSILYTAGFCTAGVALALTAYGCAAKEQPAPSMLGGNPAGGAGMGVAGDSGGGAGNASNQPGNVNAGAGGSGATAGSGSAAGTGGSQPMVEMLDPNVDWTALTLVYPTAYSAHDGVHTFQVPFYVDGATVELSGWSAIPSSAVSFDPDPELGGVIVTVLENAPQITIAARSGAIGGTATLHVTGATPEQWEMGKARYANGVEFNLPTFTLADFQAMLLNPNWMPPEAPPNLACNNCHTTGAKYFEIQHTPTQAARFSDEDLRTILTTGMKPPGIGFRLLPPTLFGMSAQEVYADFHAWDASDDEIKGLIVYLRSLTPEGQGDILLPDGTYIAPGQRPPGLP